MVFCDQKLLFLFWPVTLYVSAIPLTKQDEEIKMTNITTKTKWTVEDFKTWYIENNKDWDYFLNKTAKHFVEVIWQLKNVKTSEEFEKIARNMPW